EFPEIARIEQDQLILLGYYRNSAEVLALEERRYAEARELGERAVELSKRLEEWWNRVEVTATLAVSTAGTGDIATADALLEEASHGATIDVFAVATLAYCRARVHAIAGRIADADAAYDEAIDRIDA